MGDTIFYKLDVIHTAHWTGDESAIGLASLVLETGAPLLMAADMHMVRRAILSRRSSHLHRNEHL